MWTSNCEGCDDQDKLEENGFKTAEELRDEKADQAYDEWRDEQ